MARWPKMRRRASLGRTRPGWIGKTTLLIAGPAFHMEISDNKKYEISV
jgi:hypothetical protein